jgi:hypothetical protein
MVSIDAAKLATRVRELRRGQRAFIVKAAPRALPSSKTNEATRETKALDY